MDFNAWLDSFTDAVSAVDPVHIPQSHRDQQSGIIRRIAELADQPEELNRFLDNLPVEDVASTSPDTSDSSDEPDTVERELRRFRQRSGRISERRQHRIQSDRERNRRANTHRFGSTFHLDSLFDGSVWGHEGTDSTADESPEEEGAVGYDAGARPENEFWDQLSLEDFPGLTSNSPDAGRTFLGQTIVEARANVKRALLVATLEIKRDNPGRSAEFAWMLLNDRLVRERVVQWYSEVSQTWYFAFGRPARLHFLSIYQAEPPIIEALWDSL